MTNLKYNVKVDVMMEFITSAYLITLSFLKMLKNDKIYIDFLNALCYITII